MTDKKKPAKKTAAKKAAPKKQTAKKAAPKPAQPRKRPAAKTVVSTQSPKTSTTTLGDIKVEITATIPENVKQTIEETANVIATNVVKANDIVSPSLRARVLKWFTRK